MRLIDADALIAEFHRLKLGEHSLIERFFEDGVYAVIDTFPTIDAVPVVHGEWVEENRRPRSTQFVCSVCHRTAYDPQPTRDQKWEKRCRYAYCPNCGARMNGEGGKDDI